MLVVTDVDNTIYDWVAVWAGAFDALLHTLEAQTGRHRDDWIKAARDVHVRRSATECPSLLCELAAAPLCPTTFDQRRVMEAAAAAYRNYWDHHLTPFAGMREALVQLAEQGHTVVAYTESDVSIAATRLARLGLAGVIRRVFGRTPLPAASVSSWGLAGGTRSGPIAVDFIPREDNKPNPAGLRTIVAMCDASPHNTVYIGDNLWKDIVMAQRLGACAMWARYGTSRDRAHTALLQRVAHWTPDATAAERSATPETVTPDVVLDDPRELPRAVVRRVAEAVST
jgi:phosphoglycolate phosphatase